MEIIVITYLLYVAISVFCPALVLVMLQLNAGRVKVHAPPLPSLTVTLAVYVPAAL